jgi:hypothetical protein
LSTRRLADWGLDALQDDQWADVVLVDPFSRKLTEDGRSLLALGSTIEDAVEKKFFGTLSQSLDRLPLDWQDQCYTALRSFVVRNPLPSQLDLDTFRRSYAHFRPDKLLQELYVSAENAIHLRMKPGQCQRCGALANLASKPAICANRACRMEGAAQADTMSLEDLSTYRAASSWAMEFWIAPGFHEIARYDALEGRQLSLYPARDAADISIEDVSVGIDIKTYASPYLLGRRLQRAGLGRLARYARRIIAYPDVFEQRRPAYRRILMDSAGPVTKEAEFKTVSEVIEEFAP